MSAGGRNSNRNERGQARQNYQVENRFQRQENVEPNRSEIVGGPQEGGFDTSSWGNSASFYPNSRQNRNASNQQNRTERNERFNQTTRNEPNRRFNQTTTNNQPCEIYKSEEQVLIDIQQKKTIRGILRINAKQFTDSFITDPNGGEDFYIDNVRDRNRALNSDEVAAEIKPKRQWKIIPQFFVSVEKFLIESIGGEPKKSSLPNSLTKRETIENLFNNENRLTDEIVERIPNEFFQRTVKVVFIFRRRNSMKAAGFLKKMSDNNPNFALFSPMDSRVPRMMIPMEKCPKDFQTRFGDYSKSLFVAKIVEIPADKNFAIGELFSDLGDSETLEAQSKAILMENDVNDEEFSSEVVRCLPLEEDRWKIPAEEISKRLDLRNRCIFTIDPASARDLDDALSCESLGNGLFRVGVHIADVSFFVKEQTPLDTEASQRTTSVYLVDRVVPMLPRLLCDRLCSLNPAEDRLTFSVIWTMNEEAEILDEEIRRSVIRSCVKLSYDHAQSLLENPSKEFSADEIPKIEAPFDVAQIHRTVVELFKLSKKLRSKRSGALVLNQPKIDFRMKICDRSPMSLSIYEQKDSNRLVEEFMLLANSRVAKFLSSNEKVRAKTILRRHPPPNPANIQKTIKQLNAMKTQFSQEDFKSLDEKLSQFENDSTRKLIVHLLAKSMQLAVYSCFGAGENQDFSHFALNIDFYTHFTSPIRRYPDILVHRSLAAAVENGEEIFQSVEQLESIAQLCNEKKTNAKTCSERSAELHLAFFIKEFGNICEPATIVAVKDQSFDVYLHRIGVALRIGINNLPLDHPRTNFLPASSSTPGELTIFWKIENPPADFKQILKPSDVVFIDLTAEFDNNQKKYKLTGQLRHPKEEKVTTLLDICRNRNDQIEQTIQQIQDFDPYTDY